MIYRIIAAALALTISATASSAAVMTYTDRTLWETELNKLPGATFTDDPFDNDIAQAQSITFDSGVVSQSSGSFSNSVSGGMYRGSVADFTSRESQVTWTFPTAIQGFGADWVSTADGGVLQVTINDGTGSGDQVFNFGTLLGGNGTGFLGFVGTGDFTSVLFQDSTLTPDNAGENYEADNLSFATVIPLPAGLLALGLIGRRAKRAA